MLRIRTLVSIHCTTLVVRGRTYFHDSISPHVLQLSRDGKGGRITRTTLRGCARGVCRVSAAGGVAVLNVLHALCLVRVREPVLAHVQVVAEAAGGAGHEDLGNGEGRHDCRCVLETWDGVWCSK
jgi:hypothetical protein